jgi:peptidoglycan/LPS O-acetylase OafA/YrhL
MSKILNAESKRTEISGYTSIALDSLRLLAAFTVVIIHGHDQWMSSNPNNSLPGLEQLSHAGVIIFFVLSGYVIAYTTSANNRGPQQYAIARLSRLYSMLIPALIISTFAQYIVSKLSPAISAEFTRGASWPRYLLSGAFLNEIGFLSAAPPINRPLWSLSYEFWYYVIFGLLFFQRNDRWKSPLLTILACVIAGPKILLLMPIWLSGCMAYKFQHSISPKFKSWLFFFMLLGIAGTVVIFLNSLPFKLGIKPFFYSNQFITDYLVGFLIAFALGTLPNKQSSQFVSTSAYKFRKFADLTFPLYVFHHPILILWKSIFDFHMNDRLQMWLAISISIAISLLIGTILENQRHLWTSLFRNIFAEIRKWARQITPRNRQTI